MIQALFNAFKIPDLKKKIVLTLALIGVYRIGSYVPTPGINTKALAAFFGFSPSAIFFLIPLKNLVMYL